MPAKPCCGRVIRQAWASLYRTKKLPPKSGRNPGVTFTGDFGTQANRCGSGDDDAVRSSRLPANEGRRLRERDFAPGRREDALPGGHHDSGEDVEPRSRVQAGIEP